jgi:2-polyprenyl-3-methyl-5-hydroxy-6-metoxy-1,4-benzoquinol methylase
LGLPQLDFSGNQKMSALHNITLKKIVRYGVRQINNQINNLKRISATDVRNFDIDLMMMALKDPQSAHDYCINKHIDLKNICFKNERYDIPHGDQIWSTPSEKIILQTANDLIQQLNDYDEKEMGSHALSLNREFFKKYLYMNVVRVAQLHSMLNNFGLKKGRILEIGSYFGSFSLALQRLGYDVTAVDRYDSYGQAFSSYTQLMKDNGVTIISTSRDNEIEMINDLGEFDAVISMAVVEHIPHTPRLFLESLLSHVKHGGVLAVDTPNLARYWAREDLKMGKSIFQDIKEQYFCDIPFKDHHREYTQSEMEWIFNQLPLENITSKMFDYNQFQFESIDKNHIDCIIQFIKDTSYADTILVGGVKK